MPELSKWLGAKFWEFATDVSKFFNSNETMESVTLTDLDDGDMIMNQIRFLPNSDDYKLTRFQEMEAILASWPIEQTGENDKEFASYLVLKAQVKLLIVEIAYISKSSEIPSLKAMLMRGVQLDSGTRFGSGLVALGRVCYEYPNVLSYFNNVHDTDLSLASFNRALVLYPTSPMTHHFYAEFLQWDGKTDEAIDFLENWLVRLKRLQLDINFKVRESQVHYIGLSENLLKELIADRD